MPREYDPQSVALVVNTIKGLAMDAVQKANSGHPGTPMGLADIAFELWTRYLRHDPKAPEWIGRDRFVLSCGHASMLLYAMLHLSGYDLSLEDIKSFRQWESKTPGHPEHFMTRGVETTTGPLGQGIGNAIGMALASKMQAARFGEPFEGQRVFVLASDGDVMEGVSGEASSIAGHLGLANVVVIYDDNNITIDGRTEITFTENVGKRYEAYGWFVQTIDGHDHEQIRDALDKALAQNEKPSFIVAKTHIGNGAPKLQDSPKAHGAPLGEEEIAATKKAMGFDPAVHFAVPEPVYALFRERAAELAKEHAAWEQKYQAWRSADPKRASELDAFLEQRVPADLYEQLVKALPEKEDATRGLSSAIQQTVAKLVPALVGGSADLAESTKTTIKGGGDVARGSFAGRNLHFGIREHGMGSICNGLALSGFLPYGSTFLVFSDYMRPAVRLSALGHLPCLWIYTHDSVLLGEDGPTHQPIEHVSSLRLIPNLAVVRPADALECAAAWAIALGRKKGPTAFVLTRQKVPTLKRDEAFEPKLALRGAYVVQEAAGGKPDLVIVATGSEVQLALGAKERLEKGGRKVRVVSALCLEQFAAQDDVYRASVLPKGVRRVSIEAGRTDAWRGVVGDDGLALGVDHFGSSAPDKVLAEKMGLTVASVTSRIEAWLG